MSEPTYKELKRLFRRNEALFVEKYGIGPEAQAQVIAVLAKAENDHLWPLGMLSALKPEFGKALGRWTANGYTDIRDAQEGRSAKCLGEARCIEDNLSCLPLWRGEARHYSKNDAWYDSLSDGDFRLQSFMACCKPGHTFAYALNYSVVLVFTKLKSARLVGALTRENCEGEVLLPKGASFKVLTNDRERREIILEEVDSEAEQ